MEETSLLIWCAIAAVLFAAFCLTAWRKLRTMRKENYTLVYEEDGTVDAVPEFVEVEDDELDN